MIEKHFCLSRELKTPDSDFSMESDEFKRMVKDVRQAELSIGKVQYGLTNQGTGSIVFRRSILSVKDIKSGENLTEDNIRVIRPGYGLKPKYYDDLLGQKAYVTMQEEHRLDLEWWEDNRRYVWSNGKVRNYINRDKK